MKRYAQSIKFSNFGAIIEDDNGDYVKWDDVKEYIIDKPPVFNQDPEPQPEFKAGDVVKYEMSPEISEILENHHNGWFTVSNSESKTWRVYLLANYRLATPEERSVFMDKKWTRKIGEVKVRAFSNIGFMVFRFKTSTSNGAICLNNEVGEALCTALDIPICDDEPVYPL